MTTVVARRILAYVGCGGFLALAALSPTPTARADVATDYAAINAGRVCKVLTAFPSFNGINGIADAIVNDGLTYYQAGESIAWSVINVCPQHTDLLRRYAGIPSPIPQPEHDFGPVMR